MVILAGIERLMKKFNLLGDMTHTDGGNLSDVDRRTGHLVLVIRIYISEMCLFKGKEGRGISTPSIPTLSSDLKI